MDHELHTHAAMSTAYTPVQVMYRNTSTKLRLSSYLQPAIQIPICSRYRYFPARQRVSSSDHRRQAHSHTSTRMTNGHNIMAEPDKQRSSFLLGTGTLVVVGDVRSSEVNESALNDWWSNEHLPERLSIPGFLRARRYYTRDGQTNITKYLTLYEVSSLKTLTSTAYLDKLNHPTVGTTHHLSTLAKMNRWACRVVDSQLRPELQTCVTGLGAAMVMILLSLPPNETGSGLQRLLVENFLQTQAKTKGLMGFNVLQEDKAATEPGSSTESYINASFKPSGASEMTKWIILSEFSVPARPPFGDVRQVLKPMVESLVLQYGPHLEMSYQEYEFMCSARA